MGLCEPERSLLRDQLGRLKQTIQGPRFCSPKRYRLLLGERARQDHGKVIESRRRTSAGQGSPSQFLYNGFIEGELSPIQIELDHGRRTQIPLYSPRFRNSQIRVSPLSTPSSGS
jgi:hypothetical protein